MNELYRNLGFNDNPFSRFSAEEERDYLNDIFQNPKYFQTILTDIKEGRTRFIVGERGIGKSALMFRLKEELENENVLTLLIDRFDNFNLENNEKDFLIEVIKQLVNFLSILTFTDKSTIKKLTKYEKEKLAFFISEFFDTLSQSELERIYNNTTKYKKSNFLKSVYNIFFSKPVNIVLSATSETISDTVRKSLGYGSGLSEEFYKKYIPEFELSGVGKKSNILDVADIKKCKEFLEDMLSISKKCDFKKVAVFFDKIDEYPSLSGNISNITEFIKDITLDTNLLHIEDIAFVFVIWSKVKNSLNNTGVRFDKFKPIDITWTDEELKNIVEKRLGYFSNEQVTISDIIKSPVEITKVINLAYKSPRHLIMLLSRVYDEQAIIDSEVKYFNSLALSKGYNHFITNFDYPSLYPGKASRKDYIITVINKILRLKKLEFEVKDWVAEYKISTQKTSSDIKIIREYALITETDNLGSSTKKYRVIEPRLRFLIENGITKIGNEASDELELELEVGSSEAIHS
ncbi:P-loop ATPase, Sll1717 family [Bacillus sp. DJP31]|uniref:P-loop ATPase, Sll1717 family n=1 Tax=Bacillus sp. DJP31 TaxID=3409789 RepID=UPI003BB53FE4